MLSEVQPCFQLLRMGLVGTPGSASPVSQDLYTFRPETPHCVFRLGRRPDVCDVVLVSERNPDLISQVHAEIHAEREESGSGDWRVYIVDCSTHGTYVNDVRVHRSIRVELSDSDMVIFGHKEVEKIPEGAPTLQQQEEPEFYFMFQKVRLCPRDFDAITTPKTLSSGGGTVGGSCFKPVPFTDRRTKDFTKFPSGATLILNSIGSISKLKPQPLTFSRTWREAPHSEGEEAVESPRSTPPLPKRDTMNQKAAVVAHSRRKSAHTVLPELEDEVQGLEEPAAQRRKRLCRSESEVELVHCHRMPGPGARGGVSGYKRRLGDGRRNEQHREGTAQALQVTPGRKRRGRPRKHPLRETCQVFSQTLFAAEPCAADRCRLPQDDTVAWVQCDDCDSWYHVACVGCSYSAVQNSDFRCGCT
ncbi:transcription factor 19 [Microcaecilia unicolor]|uniref:Transcription factor 19 n=1 Tax=Microcaecilia unicolor TaxID=1415580 RepID=A0A6P7XJB3_9AMPH|nr:transcription factor 19 [Microcaecilia unicolor]